MEATLLGRPHAFERGEKVYLTTPLVVLTPSEQQVEEFAFASAVKSRAPNENLGWLQGRYVEAGKANLNNAMWLTDELALKSLTPMLMPVTVMHDPRTAVGTIADCKLITENANSRIDTVLGIWRHRFPAVWEEAEANLAKGQLMQSMEAFTPWYTCSECAQQYVKLPNGAEQGSWCQCLRTNSGRRILGDVCFTGTGLIFGTRGGKGAYTEAHLDHFQDEIAEYHDRAHADSTYRPQRSASTMALVQIEESELATLRTERNDARTRVTALEDEKRDLTTKAERAEADATRLKDEKAAVERERDDERAKAQKTELASRRLGALGAGFLAKLGDTSKAVLTELAGKASDDEWDVALKEREELAQVKRDEAVPGTPAPSGGSGGNGAFSMDELAKFNESGVSRPTGGSGSGSSQDAGTSVRQLARSFSGKKAPAPQAGS